LLGLLLIAGFPGNPAYAGYYSVSYSGGSYLSSWGGNPYYQLQGGSYGCPGYSAFGFYQCGGAITATFTWQPNNGNLTVDPAPQAAVIVQQSTATYLWGQGSGSCTCDDGFGDPVVTNGSNGTSSGSWTTVDTSGAVSFSVSCSPSASAVCQGIAGASESYSASAIPIQVTVTGTTPDLTVGNQPDILVGQEAYASVQGLTPLVQGGWGVITQWTVSGTTFVDAWDDERSGTQTVDLIRGYTMTGDPMLETQGWFWDDDATATESVSCNVVLTAPANGTAPTPFNVSSTPVDVMVPALNATGTAGTMTILQPIGSDTYGFIATRLPDPSDWILIAGGPSLGMVWNVATSLPGSAPFTLDGVLNGGASDIVQLWTAARSGDNSLGPWSLNYSQGLDNWSPYNLAGPENPWSNNDNPYEDVSNLGFTSITIGDSFVDYVMYTPPSCNSLPTSQVPLGTFSWNLNGCASASWSNATVVTPVTPTPPGLGPATINPAGTTKFILTNIFPSWTSLNTNTP